jgi:hypothetical protein
MSGFRACDEAIWRSPDSRATAPFRTAREPAETTGAKPDSGTPIEGSGDTPALYPSGHMASAIGVP